MSKYPPRVARRAALLLIVIAATASCRDRPARESAPTERTPAPGSGSGSGSAAPVAPTPPPPPPAPSFTWFRGLVGDAPTRVPFFLGIPTSGGDCVVVNGEERIAAPCTWAQDKLDLQFPQFKTSIHAERDATGSLAGRWTRSHLSKNATTTFVGSPIASPDPRERIPSDGEFAASSSGSGSGSQPASFGGTWRLQFEAVGLAKGTLAQTPDGVVTGTVIPTNIGDLRYLAGTVRGRTLWLSSFNGQVAYLLRAEQASTGKLTGTWTFLQVLTDTFAGERVEDVDVHQLETIRMKRGTTRATIKQLDDAAYRGKPVIVDYTASWCSACIDELPVLVELYTQFHAQGLEILTIALEATTDAAANAKQVEFLRDHFHIPWRIDVVPGEFPDIPSQVPPELENADGLPITLFLNRDGTVHDVHSGFYGPATGADYQKLRQRFEDNVRAILASPAAKPAPH